MQLTAFQCMFGYHHPHVPGMLTPPTLQPLMSCLKQSEQVWESTRQCLEKLAQINKKNADQLSEETLFTKGSRLASYHRLRHVGLYKILKRYQSHVQTQPTTTLPYCTILSCLRSETHRVGMTDIPSTTPPKPIEIEGQPAYRAMAITQLLLLKQQTWVPQRMGGVWPWGTLLDPSSQHPWSQPMPIIPHQTPKAPRVLPEGEV